MSEEEAALYVQDSLYRGPVFHGTTPNAAKAICSGGIDIARFSKYVAFAAGYYGTPNMLYAANYGVVILVHRFHILKPKLVANNHEFLDWIKSHQLHLFPPDYQAKAAALILISEGYDSIIVDTDSNEHDPSPAIVVFHPMQVVTITQK